MRLIGKIAVAISIRSQGDVSLPDRRTVNIKTKSYHSRAKGIVFPIWGVCFAGQGREVASSFSCFGISAHVHMRRAAWPA